MTLYASAISRLEELKSTSYIQSLDHPSFKIDISQIAYVRLLSL